MLASEGFRLLLADCKDKADDASYKVIHSLPTSEKDNVEQAYWRGKIVAFEDFLSLQEDLKSFLEGQKEQQ